MQAPCHERCRTASLYILYLYRRVDAAVACMLLTATATKSAACLKFSPTGRPSQLAQVALVIFGRSSASHFAGLQAPFAVQPPFLPHTAVGWPLNPGAHAPLQAKPWAAFLHSVGHVLPDRAGGAPVHTTARYMTNKASSVEVM